MPQHSPTAQAGSQGTPSPASSSSDAQPVRKRRRRQQPPPTSTPCIAARCVPGAAAAAWPQDWLFQDTLLLRWALQALTQELRTQHGLFRELPDYRLILGKCPLRHVCQGTARICKPLGSCWCWDCVHAPSCLLPPQHSHTGGFLTPGDAQKAIYHTWVRGSTPDLTLSLPLTGLFFFPFPITLLPACPADMHAVLLGPGQAPAAAAPRDRCLMQARMVSR